MQYPFEANFEDIQANMDAYVDEVFACLESGFLVMPKGPGFVEFPVFEKGYEALKRATCNFQDVTPLTVTPIVYTTRIALIVLRCMLGFTPPEWAYYATRNTGIEIPQGPARTIDRGIRLDPAKPLKRGRGGVTDRRIAALIATACDILQQGAPQAPADRLHRIDKADTASGLIGVRSMADLGVPFQSPGHDRGEADGRRRHGPRQGDPGATPVSDEHGRAATRPAPVRGHRLYRRSRLRGAPRGHEKTDPGDPRQGLYLAEYGSPGGCHAVTGVSVAVTLTGRRYRGSATGGRRFSGQRRRVWRKPRPPVCCTTGFSEGLSPPLRERMCRTGETGPARDARRQAACPGSAVAAKSLSAARSPIASTPAVKGKRSSPG